VSESRFDNASDEIEAIATDLIAFRDYIAEFAVVMSNAPRMFAPRTECNNNRRMHDAREWNANTADAILAEGEVHVWRAHLDCGAAALERYHASLSADEKDRAGRFRFDKDRNSFVATRGILRDLLGKYAGRAPAEIEFEYGERGKPSLRANDHSNVQFNVSGSHGLALFGFALGRQLGIDVELIRPDFVAEKIAARYFAPREVEELRSLPPSQLAEGFFRGWTRKEAYIKARGEGMRISLNSFSISLTPGQPATLQCEDCERWSLYSLEPGENYEGALVAEGKNLRIRCWEWKLASAEKLET
jgi:4'-phosphopantetheinyl transferase